ncbi:MAG: lamin tail domain-containing protein [Verrucomicrobia bacterium]|nr:lamin tail domain-containing protein [Verrucomicrobiota bacterium]
MRFLVSLSLAAFALLFPGSGSALLGILHAQHVPVEVGQTVRGFQEDFGGTTLSGVWKVAGEEVYSVGDGRLRVTSAGGDPNHLLYQGAPYDATVQEVLARMRILEFGSGDAVRGGVATAVSDDFANEGINYHFRNEPSEGDRHFEFLDDKRAWANEDPFPWKNDTWYWVRLRHEPDAASGGGTDDVFAKVWLADGSTPEPSAWQNTWNYTGAGFSRTGFAGIVAGSSGGLSEFEVDYFLLKSPGLPEITVAPAAFPQIQVPVAITNQPQDLTVAELAPATFQVAATGNPEPTFQWFRNGAEIQGATNATYELAAATVMDDQALFTVVARNVASNTLHSVTSREARLTVIPDREAPVLLAAESLGLNQVGVTFSEAVSVASATDTAHYVVSGPSGSVSIQRATLEGNFRQVVLEVAPLTGGITYTLEVRDIADQSAAGNTVAAGSRTNFVAASLASADIGNPATAGSTVAVPGGYDLTAGGADIGGTSDQLRFSGLRRTGNFDLQVRVQSLTLADAWSEAGLMARESVNPDSSFVAALATPSIGGTYFQSRAATGARAAISGSFPVNYPHTWLRLRREGNQFTGFASRDGRTWTVLGSTNLALPSSLLVGLAASSHHATQTVTAAFRDYGPWAPASGSPAVAPVEPPGQSSRLTSLVISEIMYHPPPRADGRQLEFIELFNTLGTPEDLSGYRIAGDVDYTFPAGTVIPGGGFLVVARNPADLAAVYGLSGILGPFDGSANLPNDEGTIRLRNRVGAVFLEVEYSRRTPWPVAADGTGHSLVLSRPSLGEADPQAWDLSDAAGGSPGRLDPFTPDARRQVRINEVLVRGGEAGTSFVELFNAGQEPADLSGCVLTDDPAVSRFVLPPGTTMAPGAFLAWNLQDTQLRLPPDGGLLFLRDPEGVRILDAVELGGQEAGVSTGRHPDGANGFQRLEGPTPVAANAGIRLGEVILNELMYHPISGLDDDQYVELFNRGSEALSLAGWRLAEGISFAFPDTARIAAGGYVVVAKNAARLLTNHPTLTAQNTFGDFAGRLSGRGERIVLLRPETVPITNQSGAVIATVVHVPLDEVSYRDGGRWGQWADGGGSSLERVSPEADSRAASSWADSDETGKAPWTSVSVTGVLDNGDVSVDQLQVLLQGAGECLIDEVRVTSAGVNRIANSTFQSNANGWTAEGTEATSG